MEKKENEKIDGTINALEQIHLLGIAANRMYTAGLIALFHLDHPEDFDKDVVKRFLISSMKCAVDSGFVNPDDINKQLKMAFDNVNKKSEEEIKNENEAEDNKRSN